MADKQRSDPGLDIETSVTSEDLTKPERERTAFQTIPIVGDCPDGCEPDRSPDPGTRCPLRLVAGALWCRGDRKHRASWRGSIPGEFHHGRYESAQGHVRALACLGTTCQLGSSEQL